MRDELIVRQAGSGEMAGWRSGRAGNGITAGPFWLNVLVFSAAVALYQLAAHFLNYVDYVGPDPDDSMRLVEVRDYLAGQNWFDLTQYRLGPEGGTLMHWSRLIDWPIAMLISGFSRFLSPQMAEAAALTAWPLLLIFPLLASAALASYRLGGKGAMVVGLILSSLFLAAIVRFRPGAIDHHNVQLILATFIAAMLIDPKARASNFALAALAGGLALAIGVETTPLVAVCAMIVAMLWVIDPGRYRRAAIGFGLALAIGTSAIFIGTTPARLMSSVTCDTLSLGFYALAAAGGVALAVAALAVSRQSLAVRFASLGVIGAIVGVTALLVAPQCLHNPLNDLDPLLKTMWLGNVTEAQSIVSEFAMSPQDIGGFYAVGLIAVLVSIMRISRGEQVAAHSILLVMIAVSWALTAFQIRGMIFANFLAFIPLSALIADLRQLYLARQKDARAATAFVMSALASVPSVWTVAGVLAFEAGGAVAGTSTKDKEPTERAECITADSMRPLATMPQGRILSTSNPGSLLLRFTPHSVLTANYHRNQTGMVAALKMAMAEPSDALAAMERDGVSYVVLCRDDPQIGMLEHDHGDGLFARLARNEVPPFLEEVSRSQDGNLSIYQTIRR